LLDAPYCEEERWDEEEEEQGEVVQGESEIESAICGNRICYLCGSSGGYGVDAQGQCPLQILISCSNPIH